MRKCAEIAKLNEKQKDPNCLESFAVKKWAHLGMIQGPPDYECF